MRGSARAWHERVCQGLEGEALELTLWVRGCSSPALSLPYPCSSGRPAHLLGRGSWHMSFPTRAARHPSGQPLLLAVLWAMPRPPAGTPLR